MVRAVKAKIIFLDLDGTLLDDDKRISGRDLSAIRKCQSKGMLFGIVTSRRRRKILDLCNGFSPDFIAYYDGAIAEIRKEKRFEILYCAGIIHDTCIDLCNYFIQNKIVQKCSGIAVDVMDNSGIILSMTPEAYLKEFSDNKAGVLRIRLYEADRDLPDNYNRLFEGIRIITENNDIIIGPSEINKGHAVSRILEYFRTDAKASICFGDSESDLSMFSKCAIAVAMQNSNDTVKAASDYITLSNQCSGVADFIERNILDPMEGPVDHIDRYHMVRSTFPEEECVCLLKDLTGQMEPVSFEEKLRYLKSGGKSYDIICRDDIRTEEELTYIRRLIDIHAPAVARKTAILSEKLYLCKEKKPVLVSLARGGIPYGVLCGRYLRKYYQYSAPHYVISLVRGVGFDENALEYILGQHEDKDIVFVDGWTGSGYLTDQLKLYVNKFNSDHGTHIVPEMAVVADLAEVCRLNGTTEDVFLPSACLNAEVSGLISSICINKKYISVKDFHGCIFMDEMKASDLSVYYADTVSAAFQKSETACEMDLRKGAEQNGFLYKSARAAILEQLGFVPDTKVRLGIGESFRALFRQPLACIVVNNENDPDVRYLIESAAAKKIKILQADFGKYKGAAVLL